MDNTTKPPPTPPVIVRAVQGGTVITKKLSEWFRVRVCMVIHLDKLLDGDMKRIEQMGQNFKTSYVIGIMQGGNTSTVMKLQTSLKKQPKFMPVFDEQEACEAILDVLEYESTNGEKSKLVLSEVELNNAVVEALCTIPGLRRHDCLILQQALGSLATISRATAEEIRYNTSLSAEKAKIVEIFFKYNRSVE